MGFEREVPGIVEDAFSRGNILVSFRGGRDEEGGVLTPSCQQRG